MAQRSSGAPAGGSEASGGTATGDGREGGRGSRRSPTEHVDRRGDAAADGAGEPLAVRADDGPAEVDPLIGDRRVQQFLGAAFPAVDGFHRLLTEEGVLRGLIGPREVPRLWERHLLNSAAVAQHLPASGRVVDVGSGAGLPGIVLAAMLPDVEVVLLEPMERRTDWLVEVAQALHLTNAVVRRGRAEEAHGDLLADAVTARAVAPMDRLARWTLPLLRQGGVLVALKGRQAGAEVESARHVLRKLGADSADVIETGTIDGLETTTVVRVVRVRAPGPSGGGGVKSPRRG